MYLSFGASDSSLASLFYESNFAEDLLETPVILSAILSPIKSSVASAVFWIALLEENFIAPVVDFFCAIKKFLTIFTA